MTDPDTRPVVLVTGAAGGLGRGLTEAFGVAGWRVAAAGHTTVPSGAPEGSWVGRMDVCDRGQVRRTVQAVVDQVGALGRVGEQRGADHERLLLRTDGESWQRVLDVHLKGAFLCSQAALEPMVRRGTGHILNIASFAARSGPAGQSAYAAAKAGLIGMTLALAREVGPQGIRVNAVLPGVLPTGMTEALSAEAWGAFRSADVLGRSNSIPEVAAWIAGLAAVPGMSGQVLACDGRIARWT